MIRDAVRKRLAERADGSRTKAVTMAAPGTGRRRLGAGTATLSRLARQYSILGRLDMTQAVPKRTYDVELERQQGRMNRLQRRARDRGTSMILVFEGWDAAGKGGAIRRVTAALDARQYQVIPIAAPTDEERAHHYLWRFWRHLARAGRVTIFDRSWYGRVLVERVEQFAQAAEWMRAYSEINQFEEQMAEHGIVLVKYWLHVTREEQERRFKERERSPFKAYKLTPEDWRNRAKWDQYELAVNDMVERTSTRIAPWTLVEANDKNFARLKVLRTAADRLESALP
jgi:polyphosphate kinase 2 (PPK2 family)